MNEERFRYLYSLLLKNGSDFIVPNEEGFLFINELVKHKVKYTVEYREGLIKIVLVK